MNSISSAGDALRSSNLLFEGVLADEAVDLDLALLPDPVGPVLGLEVHLIAGNGSALLKYMWWALRKKAQHKRGSCSVVEMK